MRCGRGATPGVAEDEVKVGCRRAVVPTATPAEKARASSAGRDTAVVSVENVELLKRGVEAFNRGDMDAMLALMDPDVEFLTAGLFPGVSAVYRGHDGWVAFWRDFRDTWESLSVEANEFHDAGDRVVLLLTFDARGRNGLEVHRKFANVWTIRDGVGVRIQSYGEWSAALESVGLSG